MRFYLFLMNKASFITNLLGKNNTTINEGQKETAPGQRKNDIVFPILNLTFVSTISQFFFFMFDERLEHTLQFQTPFLEKPWRMA